MPTEQAPAFDYVTSTTALEEVVNAALDAPRFALDTEFHRERTYYPRVALVQLAWADRLVLIDPLAVSLDPLAKLLEGGGLAVLHAAQQDLEVLDTAVGAVPSRLFDTQIAAGFVGLASASLAALTEKSLRRRLPKGDRLTDWLARPLTQNQLNYAAADVAHLLEIHDWLLAELTARGRLRWAEDECDDQLARGRAPRAPEDAWRRIKEARQLRGKPFDVARALAAWREERAAQLDQPVRFVLSDLALVAIAQRLPQSANDLRGIRGVDDRQLAGRFGEEVLAAARQALEQPPPLPVTVAAAELPKELRPVVPLVSAWISQVASEAHIDPALLGTRADIESFLRGDGQSRLDHGWRHDLVGEPIRQLASGAASIAFRPGRGLELR